MGVKTETNADIKSWATSEGGSVTAANIEATSIATFNGYELHKVTFTADSGALYNISKDFYCLVGSSPLYFIDYMSYGERDVLRSADGTDTLHISGLFKCFEGYTISGLTDLSVTIEDDETKYLTYADGVLTFINNVYKSDKPSATNFTTTVSVTAGGHKFDLKVRFVVHEAKNN